MTQTFTSGQVLTAEATNGELAFPTGSMLPFAGASAPAATVGGVAAWLLCDGSAVSRTTYAALFTICSTTYGAGDGSTTFNLPDLRGRMPIGPDSDSTAANTATRSVGTKGGDTRLQNHNHGQNDFGVRADIAGAGANGFVLTTAAFNAQGGGRGNAAAGLGSGENMPPFLVTNYLIKT